MRWSEHVRAVGSAPVLILALLALAMPSQEKRLTIFAPRGPYSPAVLERDGAEYVELLDLLQPLGTASAKLDGRKCKLRFNEHESEFKDGDTQAKVRGNRVNLQKAFRLDSRCGEVPVSALGALLPPITGLPFSHREDSRRIFLGIAAVQFAARFDASPAPALVLQFTAPVNPSIATEPGRLRLVFQRDPVQHGAADTQVLNDPAIRAWSYVETNGGAEIDIVGNAPLLARFSPDRKSITVVPVAQVAGQRPGTPPAAIPPATPAAPSAVPAPPLSVAAAPPPAVMIDPAHGGQDRGAIVGNLAEKDITLSFAKALRQQLESRGIHVALVREADATIPLDDRAALANRSRAQLYLAVHAVSGGSAVALYTSLLPPAEPNRGQFLAWNSAQAPYLGASLNVASTIMSELRTQRLESRSHPAPLRPLNSAALPAIAIELGTADRDPKSLASPRYQEGIASALAAAIATARSRMGTQP